MSGSRGDAETRREEVSETPETDNLWYRRPEQWEVYDLARKLERARDEALGNLEAWRFHSAAWGTDPDEVRKYIKRLEKERDELRAELQRLELQRSTVCAPSMAQLTAEEAAVSQAVFASVVGTFKAMGPKAALAALASLSVMVEVRGRLETGFLNVLLDELRADVEERLIERAAGKFQSTNN